ncbi:Profilin family protein [Euphorbia peplus]|nr:Profilin family protein [Euphorbia peplus]
MEFGFIDKSWERWASLNISSSGKDEQPLPLKAALLINYAPSSPSRLLSTLAAQEGMKVNPIEVSHFIDFIKRNKLQTESFTIGSSQYMVTSIHDNWFSSRCLNTSKPAGEGAIDADRSVSLSCIRRLSIVVCGIDGSSDAASRAMVAVDQFVWQLGRKNL